MNLKSVHTFHIPVMGLAFTVDSPIRVAHYGIDSVISIVDDELIERMSAFYAKKFNFPHQEVTKKAFDYRAKRITNYLNLVDKIVQQKFTEFKKELTVNTNVQKYFGNLLPQGNELKKKLQEVANNGIALKSKLVDYIDEVLHHGAIDVNIMTKLDKENFDKKEVLPQEFNDAHAALRGFANSNLSSSIVLSAGMNPRLYSYIENFEDFYPSEAGSLTKKIILKVSDFRSAQIQSRFLAQKGLWVSEFRIESGLNCGGHAFASDGYLLGPILEEFKTKKEELKTGMFEMLTKALETKERTIPNEIPELKVTVQGGVGTHDEHQFLLQQYKVDSVGWGSPFLLVKEATCVDDETRQLLADSQEKDLYLSEISPLGVSFNAIRNTSNERLRNQRIDKGRAGSSCPKKFLALHKKNDEQICTASRKFQEDALAQLDSLDISAEEYEERRFAITEKSCLCTGLANAAYLENDMPVKGEAQGVVICPGPNIAYFDEPVSLEKMVQHINGDVNIMHNEDRPNMFIKELSLYIDAYKKTLKEASKNPGIQATKKAKRFKKNLDDGIQYYQILFNNNTLFKEQLKAQIATLNALENEIVLA
ncbi:hypothetical protein NBRC110019_08430 [Neptunitalea chrysea]|uniref:Uncharacterized protein n=1 Tax=Neptunitalea chrysea TaxID=1647581 RepID=A0A9W6B3I4_9FLAO|nr:hypothetical protein [Neptunitalea chrysea]GLB51804.1 hypothetical protein NBRC110019_08430 [Neptunitalea chrysea]